MFDYIKFKPLVTDTTGRRLTLGLFKELSNEPSAPFSIHDWHATYVRVSDPTDYKAAMELIGNWDHWLMLCECKGFAEHLAAWRKEVDVKLRSEAIDELKKQSRSDKGTAAAKWLAEEGSRATKRTPKQQPTEDRTAGDAKRLGLIQGGRNA